MSIRPKTRARLAGVAAGTALFVTVAGAVWLVAPGAVTGLSVFVFVPAMFLLFASIGVATAVEDAVMRRWTVELGWAWTPEQLKRLRDELEDESDDDGAV
jgi:hypothetical protein